MNKVKNTKGITLVALVITIIILLILAGVVIVSLTNSGLFEKAQQAKQEQEDAEALEKERLANYENKINSYVSGDRDDSAAIAELREEIELLKAQNQTTMKSKNLINKDDTNYNKTENGYVATITTTWAATNLTMNLTDSVSDFDYIFITMDVYHNGSWMKRYYFQDTFILDVSNGESNDTQLVIGENTENVRFGIAWNKKKIYFGGAQDSSGGNLTKLRITGIVGVKL